VPEENGRHRLAESVRAEEVVRDNDTPLLRLRLQAAALDGGSVKVVRARLEGGVSGATCLRTGSTTS
jgi:hypothetical protein